MQDQGPRFIFARGKSVMSRREKLILLVPIAFFLAALIWMNYWDLLKLEDVKKVLGSAKNWQRILFMILPFFLLLFMQIGLFWAYRSVKLVVDDKQMFLEWPSDSIYAKFQFLEKRIAWEDLQNATYLSSFDIVQLRSRKSATRWAIRLRDWTVSNIEFAPGLIKHSGIDLLSVLRQRGIFNLAPKDANLMALEFDLMKHPDTRKILLGAAALLAYCFADSMMQHEGWAFFNADYLLPHVIFAVLATCLLAWMVFKTGKGERAPKGIMVAMLAIAGFSFVVTSYIAGIRVNQLLGGPLVTAGYHRDASCENLVPVESSLPVVEYTGKTKDYWCSINADELIRVKVRQGLFGKYQFDLSEQTQVIRSYFRQRGKQ